MLYVPAAQLVHDEAPVLALYVPAWHCVHTDCPVLLLKVPAGQSVHALASDVALYFPAGHGRQLCPAPTYVPGWQGDVGTQAVLARSVAVVPVGHCVHALLP